MGFFSKILAFIFLEKKARDNLARRQVAGGGGGQTAVDAGGQTAVDSGGQTAVDSGGHEMTPERVRIIAEAMKVVGQKQEILADLSDEDRQKLIDTLTGKDTGGRE